MDSYRRRDPQPLARGGEVAALVLAGLALATGWAALVGQSGAAAVFGGGWVWPVGSDNMIRAVTGLLAGHPGRGLPAAQAGRLPAAWVVYTAVVAAEVAAAAALAGAGWLAARWWRPNDPRRGMATRGQAAEVLGRRRLRAARVVLRPDLYRGKARWWPRRPAAITIPVPRRDPADDGPRPAGGDPGKGHGRVDPVGLGWRLGHSRSPAGLALWVRYDRTAGVYGAQGSGKTLDILAPALIAHPGAAMATLTKVEDLLLTVSRRRRGGRPVAVLDPFGVAPGLPELVWDPVAGCVDPRVAERRAKAFAAGTVTGAVSGGRADAAARFYAAETAKVLQGFLHAAALTGRTLEHVLGWVADPVAAEQPAEILRVHPHAAKFWDGLLSGALGGSADTVGNTVTTVQQAMGLFFQPDIRARCVPAPGRPATDLPGLIRAGGTAYLLGREDPYASASPLLTAVAEDVLDTALHAATTAAHGRLTPPFLACLDELPSTAPLPTLRVRMANERALGLSFIYAAQTWRQMVVAYGEDEARSLFGLTNTIVVFGGGKDISFYREISGLLGTARISRQTVNDGPGGVGTSRAGEDVAILRPEQLRLLPERQALVVAENAPPIITGLRRCIDGPAGKVLLSEQAAARDLVAAARTATTDVATRTRAAVGYAQAHRLAPPTLERSTGAPHTGAPAPTRAGTAGTGPAAPARPAQRTEWSW